MSDRTIKPRTLGVIPARGASKRLPRKNVMPCAGHPLIAHTVMAAAKTTMLTDWLVTSEDDEIIEVAKRYGAPVPFKRPDNLAGDKVRNIDTVNHAMEFMEDQSGEPYDMLVLLQPTCPVRDPEHIDEAVRKLWLSEMDTLASVKGPYKKRDPILKRIHNGIMEPWCDHADSYDCEPFYIYNASIYAVKRDYFVKEKKLVSARQIPLPMDKYHSADVDDLADLLVAETYLNYLSDNR